jgi:hypothetical protein
VLTRRSLLGLLALGVGACSRVKVVVQPQPAPAAPVEPAAPVVTPSAPEPTVPIVFQGGSIARPPAGGGGNEPTSLWSEPATWGGAVPVAAENVTITSGMDVTLDTDTASLGELVIQGTLRVPSSYTGTYSLTAKQVHLEGSGRFLIGASGGKFTGSLVIELTGTPTGNAHDRGIMIHDTAQFKVYAESPSPTWTKLNASAAVSATSFTAKDTLTNWRSGDEIVIGPTELYGWDATEKRTLSSAASGTSFSTTAGLTVAKWGVLQYPTNSGVSLTAGTFTVPTETVPGFPFPTVLDERAPVGNLTRRVVIQGINDSNWSTSQFGAHVMSMDRTCEVYLDGVQFRRCGQAGITGRYPFHWHINSYNTTTGAFLGDLTIGTIKNSVVYNSVQRGFVIHSTCGATLDGNILYDIRGHGIFMEDATERRNVINNNLILGIVAPDTADLLMQHEADTGVSESGSSGMWLTNPDNTITNNQCADTVGAGIWLAFPDHTLNLSTAVVLYPNRMINGTISGNTCHSTRGAALLARGSPIDNAGNTSFIYYFPTDDGTPTGTPISPTISSFTLFKGREGGYRNRVSFPNYINWVTADNEWMDFAGATLDIDGFGSVIQQTLLIGYSLNNAHDQRPGTLPDGYEQVVRTGIASYHSSVNIKNNVFMGFPEDIHTGYYGGLVGSGAHSFIDYYTNALDVGFKRNTGNLYVDTFKGYRDLPPNLEGVDTALDRNYTLAGALYDPWHYFGPNDWFIIDDPFLSTGVSTTAVAPSGTNGLSANGQFYGFDQMKTNFDNEVFRPLSAYHVIRYDSGGTEVGHWDVHDGNTSAIFDVMRHFAANSGGGRFLLEFPGNSPPTWFEATVSNLYRSTDSVIFGVQFDGATSITSAYYAANGGSGTGTGRRDMSSGANLAAVEASGGDVYWQDTGNNRVWMKVKGGLTWSGTPTTDGVTDLYRTHLLHIG